MSGGAKIEPLFIEFLAPSLDAVNVNEDTMYLQVQRTLWMRGQVQEVLERDKEGDQGASRQAWQKSLENGASRR